MNVKFTSGHISALDGIRGCAILLVLIFHCLHNLNFPITEIGWIGVDLFFVLSGFLITGILIDTKTNKNYLLTFILKRALRIFPLYYLALLLYYVAVYIHDISGLNFFSTPLSFENIFYYITYTQNLHYAFNGWPTSDTLNHFWSLAIEEQFYIIWPLLVLFVNNKRLPIVLIFLIVTSIITRNIYTENPFSYTFTLGRIDSLSIGAITAVLIRNNIEFLNRFSFPFFILSTSILSFIILLTKNISITNIHFIRYGYTLFAISFACLITFVFDCGKTGFFLKKLFNLKSLKFLGKYSYGIYVYHWILYRGIYIYLETEFSLHPFYVFLFIPFILLISVLSYHLYEKRFLAYKSKINESTNLKNIFLQKQRRTI